MINNKLQSHILCWSDSASCGTGFGVVSKYILKALHNTGLYDIHHLAINMHGDFIDTNEIPWQQQPARLLDPQDPHGMKMFIRSLLKNDYDIVWVCNDLYVTHDITNAVQQYKERCKALNKKPPIFIYYYPVDCCVNPSASSFLLEADIPVCYADFGRSETLKVLPQLNEILKQIPHGVDTKAYYPLTKFEVGNLKKKWLNVDPDTTVVINFNRNSLRKQLQYSMLAFREFRKYVPKSVMYIHTAIKDQGGDLLNTMRALNMSVKEDIIFPANYSPATPFSLQDMNELYNCGDIFLTTHLGEGWGLVVPEAMAAGVPVVAPDNTTTPQILGNDGERGYIYPCKDYAWIDEQTFRKKGLIPDIVDMMMTAYKDGPKWTNPVVSKALTWARQNDWNNVTPQWIELFKNAVPKQVTPKKVGELL